MVDRSYFIINAVVLQLVLFFIVYIIFAILTDITFRSNFDWIISTRHKPHWFWTTSAWLAWKYYHEPKEWLKIVFLFSFLYAILLSGFVYMAFVEGRDLMEIIVNLGVFNYLLGIALSALIVTITYHRFEPRNKTKNEG